MRLSILIPNYNNRRYIKKCIESCICDAISPDDYEIIVCDDCSTDGSDLVVKQLSAKYPQVRLIYNETNLRTLKTRLRLINEAKSEFIFFIDSDDWLQKSLIYKLLSLAYSGNFEVVTTRRARVYAIGNVVLHSKPIKLVISGELVGDEILNKCYSSFLGENKLPIYLAGNMYRREIVIRAFENFKNLPPLQYFEDCLFNLIIYPNCRRAYFMDSVGYCYRSGGITSKFNALLYPNHKILFCFRMQMINRYSLPYGHYTSCGEMKNIFKQTVVEMFRHKCSIDEIRAFASNEIEDDIWQTIFTPEYSKMYKNAAFTKAMIEKDVDAVLSICAKESREHYIKRKLISVFNRLFVS